MGSYGIFNRLFHKMLELPIVQVRRPSENQAQEGEIRNVARKETRNPLGKHHLQKPRVQLHCAAGLELPHAPVLWSPNEDRISVKTPDQLEYLSAPVAFAIRPTYPIEGGAPLV